MSAENNEDPTLLDDAKLDEHIEARHEAFDGLEGECAAAERTTQALQKELDAAALRLAEARSSQQSKVAERDALRHEMDGLLKLRDLRAAKNRAEKAAAAQQVAAPPPPPAESVPAEAAQLPEPSAVPAVPPPAPADLTGPIESAPLPPTPDHVEAPKVAVSAAAVADALRVELDAGTDNHLFVGFSGSIEEGGIFVATFAPRKLGEELAVVLALPDGGQVIDCRVRVAWIMDLESKNTTGMGLRFKSLADGGKAALRRYAEAHEPMFFPD